MGKKHNQDILPMKRRRFGVSRTAIKGVPNWTIVAKGILSKFKRRTYLKSVGVSKKKILENT